MIKSIRLDTAHMKEVETVVSQKKLDYAEVLERYRSYEQQHVFRFWNMLSSHQQQSFLQQLNSIDLDLIKDLSERFVLASSSIPEEDGMLSPAEVIAVPRNEQQRKSAAEAAALGEEALRAGRIGGILVAGGQGTRLGFDGPKGKLPITPVKKKSLFQLHAEKILALNRRFKIALPWYIMTSETNDAETRAFFDENQYFGLAKSDIFFFQQSMIPAVDDKGKLILSEPDRVFTNPNGHGGTLNALRDSGALANMENRGIQDVFYFQVDNVLSRISDPIFIGYHTQVNSDMSCKAVAKKNPHEKVGVFGKLDGKLTVVEYSDLSEAQMQATNDDGSLMYGAGSIATHVIKREFIEDLTGGTLSLPYHVAHKKIAYIAASGEKIEPEEPNGYKFETFIFDALQFAANPVVMEVERNEEFSPVKNPNGDASSETAIRDLCNLYGRWFETAGIPVPRDPRTHTVLGDVEISPLFALDESEFVEKSDTGLKFRDGLYLG